MMMSDDLDPMAMLGRAMAVMKTKLGGFPGLDHFNPAAELPVVVSRDDNGFATRRDILQEMGCLRRGSLVVDEVPQDNQLTRAIFAHQLHQTLGDRCHPPHRDEAAGRALAEFIAKMQVRHGQPALGLVKKSQPAIEQNFLGNEGLIRA